MRQPILNRSIIDHLHIRLFQSNFMEIAAHTWRTRDVRDPFWRFYFNFRDGAVLELPAEHGQSTFELRGERLYFVPAKVRFSCHNPRSTGHFFAHFDLIGLPSRALEQWFAAPIEVPTDALLLQRTRTLAQNVAQAGEVDLANQCRLKAIIWDALASYLEAAHPSRQGLHHLTAAHEPVRAALQMMEEKGAERLTNRELARACHLSEDHFIRRFRDCVGQTPAQYALERRLATASQQLLFSQSPIEQIAHECGFAGRHSFSRAFASHIGVAPAAYRKMSRV